MATEVVLVEWLDSRQPTSEWQHLDDMEMPRVCKCLSVGWLLNEDEERIVIAAHRNDQGTQVMGVMVIPVCAIKSKVILKWEL